MKKISLTLSLLLMLAFTFGCQQSENKSSPTLEGTASGGGGGYGNESGKEILEMAQGELVKMLSQANPDLFEKLNSTTGKDSQAELIRLVSELQQRPRSDIVRDGVRLKFNYDESNPSRPVIFATQLFFDSSAAIPLDFENWTKVRSYIQDTQVKILHEAAHVLGYGKSKETDFQAREIARRIYNAMWDDTLYCSEKMESSEFYYILNLTNGFGTRKNAKNFGDSSGKLERFLSGEKVELNDTYLQIIRKGHFYTPFIYTYDDPVLESAMSKYKGLGNFEFCYTNNEYDILTSANCISSYQKISWIDGLVLEQNGITITPATDGRNMGTLNFTEFQKKSQIKLTEKSPMLFEGSSETSIDGRSPVIGKLTCRRKSSPIKMENLDKKI